MTNTVGLHPPARKRVHRRWLLVIAAVVVVALAAVVVTVVLGWHRPPPRVSLPVGLEYSVRPSEVRFCASSSPAQPS